MTGTWVGPGSAARNTSRTSRRDQLKSGRFWLDSIIIASPLLLPMDLKKTLSGSKLVSKQM